MSLHVVVQMERGKGEAWEIHILDAEGQDEAKLAAAKMTDTNGGGWKVARVRVVEPETAEQ